MKPLIILHRRIRSAFPMVLALALCTCGAAWSSAAETTPDTRSSPAPQETTPGTNLNGLSKALAIAAAQPAAKLEGEGWKPLFNGKNLEGWQSLPFAAGAEAEVQSGLLVLNFGDPLTGVRHTNAFPTLDYEIALEAMRVQGSDFFCGLTLPVGSNHCTLIIGGWGGSLVGISSIDGLDASENETARTMQFEQKRWYNIRAKVTKAKIEAWIDGERVVNARIMDRTISMRPGEIEKCKPLGLATFQTQGAFRGICWRELKAQ